MDGDTMRETQDGRMDLAGFQSEERLTSALRVRIDYQSPRYEHFMRPLGEDFLFSFSLRRGQWNSGEIRETVSLDPFAIRHEFERVDNEAMAVRFLSEAGKFWPFESVLWSQFREWQDFFKWVRIDPDEAKKTPEGKKAWATAAGLETSFFTTSDSEFTHARFLPEAIEEIGADRFRQIELSDRKILWALRRFALSPEWADTKSRISLGFYDPQGKHQPENWQAKKKTPKGGYEPYLQIEAHNVLEAIAATIYADRIGVVRYGKCKHCGKLFRVISDHGQEFCTPPPRLKTSPCKNAFMQKQRRTNEKKNAIDFVSERLSQGLSEAEIGSEAAEAGIRLSRSIWSKAKGSR